MVNLNGFPRVVVVVPSSLLALADFESRDVKLFGYDFRGHTRGTLVVEIAYGCPNYGQESCPAGE